ncbi:AMP-binding protein, partial [Calothrix rhizosoleniae]|uniref:AMP-binding protein n=1 Tax=Calothrix rhizosoleniae TaxID=888997 RepID=UPI001178684D
MMKLECEKLCITQLLELQATINPDNIAITAPGRTGLTYYHLFNQIKEVVIQLNAIGVGRNDRVAVSLANGSEMAVAFLAVACAATCAPLNPAYRAQEFEFYLRDINAKALIIQPGVSEIGREVAQGLGIPILELYPALEDQAGLFNLTGVQTNNPKNSGFAQADDVALVLHTSGTNSRPKIVPLTHSNLCTSAQNIVVALNLAESDRCLNVMPLFHIHGLIGVLLSSLSTGGSVVCTPGFKAPKFFDWLAEFRPTWYSAV